MAETASREKVASDLRPPNFRSAISLIRSTLDKKKEKIASVNGEIADMWAKVAGYKVNKKAAKVFFDLDKMEAADREDFMRSFNGLAQNADWPDVVVDLVDTAEGKALQMRLGPDARKVTGDDDQDDDEDSDGDEEKAAAKQATNAIDRARGHLRGSDGEARLN
ncbi:hypothetical protein [Rhizorhabdus sp.]|uniref:hypothetical protein n=1 Tax=Rhizorhabdus sp. TaxID=1968843 RepID=UPI0035AE5D3B